MAISDSLHAHPVGWECPSCHSVYAPHVFKCPACPRSLGQRIRDAEKPLRLGSEPPPHPYPKVAGQ